MREILFRGKCIGKGEWVYGLVVKTEKGNVFIVNTAEEYGCGICIQEDANRKNHQVIPETVGQYIGLTDKNGKKVFEGDIMAYERDDGTDRVEGVVAYGKFNCTCCDGVYGWHITDGGDIRDLKHDPWLYVCGNIHDNPEKVK